MKKTVLIFLAIFLCQCIVAQNDECLRTNVQLVDSIHELHEQVETLKNLVTRWTLESAMWRHRYDSIAENSCCAEKRGLKDSIKILQAQQENYKNELTNYKEEVDKLSYFKKKWLAQTLEENKATLQLSFSELSTDQLDKMEKLCIEITDEPGVTDVLRRIQKTKSDVVAYYNAYLTVNSTYESEIVTQSLEALSRINQNEMPSIQMQDIQEMISTLQSYKKSVKDFQLIIDFINYELEEYRKSGNREKTEARLRKLYHDIHEDGYDMSICVIPYLKSKYEEYCKDLDNNPLVNSKVEKEILNIKL